MKYTTNYNLKKPEGPDIVNIDDLNENTDIIDQKLKELEDGVNNAPPNSVNDAAIGSRTPDQSLAPASPGTGTLTQLVSWLANRIKTITGKTNWWDEPPTTLQAAKTHMDATSGIHGATSSATANRIIIRDSAGRAKVAAPSASDDIATKGYVDSQLPTALPAGVIVMWSGSADNIPSGWALCDGSNGTPDLRDRFIVGAGGNYNVGDTGGADSVTLTVAQMPRHDHGSGDLTTTTDGSHSHTYTRPTGGMSAAEGDWDIYRGADPANTSSEGSHSHSVTGYTSYTGGDQPHENRPPYYALCFIMKL